MVVDKNALVMFMNRKFNRKFWLVFLGFSSIFILISVTYSRFSDSLFKSVNGEKIGIDEETYGSTSFDATNIELVPILDEDVMVREDNVIHISFLVGGSKDNTINDIVYDVALNDLRVDCNLISPYVKWKLLKNGVEISRGNLDYQFDTIKDGRLVLTNIQQDLPKYDKEQKNYDFYDFYLWISDNCQEDMEKCFNLDGQDNLMGKVLKGKVEVELYASSKKKLVREPRNKKDISTCIYEDVK